MDLSRRRTLALNLFGMEEWQIVVDAIDRMEIAAVNSLREDPRDESAPYELHTLGKFKEIITQLAENAGYDGKPFEPKSR